MLFVHQFTLDGFFRLSSINDYNNKILFDYNDTVYLYIFLCHDVVKYYFKECFKEVKEKG